MTTIIVRYTILTEKRWRCELSRRREKNQSIHNIDNVYIGDYTIPIRLRDPNDPPIDNCAANSGGGASRDINRDRSRYIFPPRLSSRR